MGKKIVTLLVVILSFLFATSIGQAAILDVRNGELFGASGVDVNGVLYNVAFLDGTAIELYDGADENSDFPFTNLSDLNDSSLIVAASQALLDQVLIDSPLGAFDSAPNLINGCRAPGACYIYTPLWVAPSGAMGVVSVYNKNTVGGDDIGAGSGSNTFDTGWWLESESTADYDRAVYAVWSKTSSVPVPAAFWLLGSGFLSLVGIGMRIKK